MVAVGLLFGCAHKKNFLLNEPVSSSSPTVINELDAKKDVSWRRFSNMWGGLTGHRI
jgi:hypothetical protein